jgi:Gpi18-like mannosyltransferase
MKKILLFFVFIKLLLFSTLLLSYFFLPHQNDFYQSNFIYPHGEKFDLYSVFKTWDGQHYLFLAENGYSHAGSSAAFYPLFPLLISLFRIIIPQSILAGYVLVTLLSLGMIYFFYRLVERIWNKDVAYISSLLFICFPTSFYSSILYSESLFLFLVLLFFWFLVERKYFLAGVVSFFIPFARPVGIFIFLPFLIWFYQDRQKVLKQITLPSFSEKIVLRIPYQGLFVSLPLIGFVAYLILMKMMTGDFFTSFSQQENFFIGFKTINILSPDIFIKAFYTIEPGYPSFASAIVDRFFAVIFLLLLPFIYKYLGKIWFWYAIIFGTVFVFGTFTNYLRYISIIFPRK